MTKSLRLWLMRREQTSTRAFQLVLAPVQRHPRQRQILRAEQAENHAIGRETAGGGPSRGQLQKQPPPIECAARPQAGTGNPTSSEDDEADFNRHAAAGAAGERRAQAPHWRDA